MTFPIDHIHPHITNVVLHRPPQKCSGCFPLVVVVAGHLQIVQIRTQYHNQASHNIVPMHWNNIIVHGS